MTLVRTDDARACPGSKDASRSHASWPISGCGVNPVKIEKQKLLLLLLFSVSVLLLVLLGSYDPYAERAHADDLMGLILSRMGLGQLGNGF